MNMLLLTLPVFIGLAWSVGRMNDITNLARTIWGEARGEGREGMIAVANSIMNRVGAGKWFSGTVTDVVTKPYQFSVWNKSDPNYKLITSANEKTPGFLEAIEIAALAMNNRLPDLTMGATHYHTKQIRPKWADPDKITTVIGNHVFYKGIN